MEFHQLEYLIAIAEEKTILKASEKLLVSQPALTRSIQRLEEELGYPLFDRIKNRLVLNQMGELAVKHAKQIIKDREKMTSALHNLYVQQSTITYGCTAPAPLWGIRQILKSGYDKENIHGTINEDSSVLLEQFMEQAYRFLILDFSVQKRGLQSVPLMEEQLYVAVKKNHPWADHSSITFEEMNGATFLRVSNTGYWSELTKEEMPDSLILVQEDVKAYQALMEASDLPVFRSSLTIASFQGTEERIYIPIENAKLTFYGIFHSEDAALIDFITSQLNAIPWQNFSHKEI